MDTKAVFAVTLLVIFSVVTLSDGQRRPRRPPCDGVMMNMRCYSDDRMFKRCPHYNGTIVWARIRRDNSGGACRQNDSWGYNEESFWVDKGCRAVFEHCMDLQLEISPPFKGPPVCPQKLNYCCEPGELQVNLAPILPSQIDNVHGIYVNQMSQVGISKACNRQALVVADFEPITPWNHLCFGCVEGPYCGRRMLKIDLILDYYRSGWLFNVGDSVANDGDSGDGGLQQHNAEFHCKYPNIIVYSSSICGPVGLVNIVDGCGDGVNTITLYVSNNYIRITNNMGLDYKRCSRCLFALNGQPDTGGSNNRVYIGLNRVVKLDSPITKTGYGVCYATFSWACPWC